jgi:hypothetical protein
MTQVNTKPKSNTRADHLLRKTEERVKAFEQIRGMWKNRTPDPIQELEEMRKEWERDPLT